MQTQYLRDTAMMICCKSDKCYVRRCVYIHSNRAKKTCNGGHRTIKKGATTDPKKHFEVINFILGHFVNFLEEIYQEDFLDVGSPLLKLCACTHFDSIFTQFGSLEVKLTLGISTALKVTPLDLNGN